MFLEYLPSPMHDDNLGFGVGASMLLEAGTAQSSDRTGDVLSKLAELTAQIAKLATGGPFSIFGGRCEDFWDSKRPGWRRHAAERCPDFTITEFARPSGSTCCCAGEMKTESCRGPGACHVPAGLRCESVAASTIVLSARWNRLRYPLRPRSRSSTN